MNSAFQCLVFAAALLSQGGMVASQAADAPMPVLIATPQQLSVTRSASETAGVSQVSGQSATVLYGDPTKTGLYTVLLRLEPHKRIMPLSHPDSRFVTILSGTFYIAFGDTFDETKLKALPPGGIYTEPAKTNTSGNRATSPSSSRSPAMGRAVPPMPMPPMHHADRIG
jgi:hypothetical protein